MRLDDARVLPTIVMFTIGSFVIGSSACRDDDHFLKCPNGEVNCPGPTASGGTGGSVTTTATTTSSSVGGAGGDGGGLPDGPWIPIAGLEPCEAAHLDLTRATWPMRSWKPCGAGCLMSDPLPVPSVAFHLPSGASLHGGELYMRTVTWTGVDGDGYEVLERLVSGEVLHVTRFKLPPCLVNEDKTHAAFVLNVFNDDLENWIGRYDVTSGQVEGAFGITTSLATPAWFTFDGGWGFIDGTSVRVSLEPSTPATTTIWDGGGYYVLNTRARGELVAWVDWSTAPTTVRSWTQAGGVEALFQGSWDVANLALGESRMVWVGVHGPQTVVGIYTAAELYYSPLTSDPAQVQVTQGPDLPGLQGVAEVAVAGDYAAVTGWDDGYGTILLAHLPTNQLWEIPRRAGFWMQLKGMTDDEVLAVEGPELGQGFLRYYRFSIAHINELAAGRWGP